MDPGEQLMMRPEIQPLMEREQEVEEEAAALYRSLLILHLKRAALQEIVASVQMEAACRLQETQKIHAGAAEELDLLVVVAGVSEALLRVQLLEMAAGAAAASEEKVGVEAQHPRPTLQQEEMEGLAEVAGVLAALISLFLLP